MRTILFISTLLSLAAANDAGVRAYVEDPTVTVGSPFMVMVEINGRTSNMPQMPAVDGLRISPQPSTQSTRMEFSSTTNQIVNKQEYGYTARATKAGSFTIPPVTIIINGKAISTEPIAITAVDAAVPQSQPAAATQGGQARPRTPNGQVSLDDAVFVESTVDKREVYQGEPVELKLNVWVMDLQGFRAGNYRGQQLEPPECEGFYATPIEPSESTSQRDGRSYQVLTYRRVLYPTATGELKIGEWHWTGGAAYGYDRWDIDRTAPAIPIKVLELPARPANFTGAVGDFTLESHVSRTEAVQGVPIQLIVTIKGKGNPDAVGAPSLPKVENAYVSDPDRSGTPADAAAAGVEKTFTYNVTPLQPGELKVPAVEFCYFDPTSASYKTQSSQPLVVPVKASTESAPRPVVAQNAVEATKPGSVSVMGDDIFPPVAAPANLKPWHPSTVAMPIVIAAPVAAFAGIALVMRRKRRFESDPAYARSYHAKTKAFKRLNGAGATDEAAEELYKGVIGYIADRHNVSENGLTSQEVGQLLEADGVDAEIRDNVRKILRACERSRYGGGKLSADEVHALTQAAIEAIEQLELGEAAVAGGRAR